MLTEEFKTAFAKYVKDFEGEKLKIYDDGFGVPTIGNGFALINKIHSRWEPFPEDKLKEKGLNLTRKQLDIIQAYANLKTKGESTAKLKFQLKQIKDSISPELCNRLLMSSIQDKYNMIKHQIGEEHWDKLNFAQQVGIMDHCFQRGNILKLKQALISGDYKKTAKIMRIISPALKARADLRADFVEYGVMEFPGIHVVKPGDTLAKIAKTNSLSLMELKKINPELSESKVLSVGQKLKISFTEVNPLVIVDEKGNKIFRFEIVHRNEQKDNTMDKTIQISSGAFFVRLEINNFTTNIRQISKDFDETRNDQMFLFKDSLGRENSVYHKIFNLTENKYNKVMEYLASGIKYGDVQEFQQEATVEPEKALEDYYVVRDDNISLIQDLYHATGLPLYFTVAYSKEEFNNLQSEDAKKAFEKYGCRDNIKQNLNIIHAESKEEVSDVLNIDKKMVGTTSNFWSCFSSGNTEFKVKVDDTLLDSITSIISPDRVPKDEDDNHMSEIFNDLFLGFKLPPAESDKNVKNYDFSSDDTLKFKKLKGLIEEEMLKNKDKLEKLLLGLEKHTASSGGNLTEEELLKIYKEKISELQKKFMKNWKVYQDNPKGYVYQPGDKLPGSASFDQEQQKLNIWISGELSKISGKPSNKSVINETNMQQREQVITEWNNEMDILRKKPEFNDKLNESLNDTHTTILAISQDMAHFFESNF